MAETPVSISEEQIQAYKKLIELDPPGWEGAIGEVKSVFPDLAKVNPINQDQIDKLKGPIINLHPSFLPYGRGIYPILWGTALNHPLGSTIHLIENKEIDNGSIIIQEQFFFTQEQEQL